MRDFVFYKTFKLVQKVLRTIFYIVLVSLLLFITYLAASKLNEAVLKVHPVTNDQNNSKQIK